MIVIRFFIEIHQFLMFIFDFLLVVQQSLMIFIHNFDAIFHFFAAVINSHRNHQQVLTFVINIAEIHQIFHFDIEILTIVSN